MSDLTTASAEQAQSLLAAGDYGGAHAVAVELLAARPHDPLLLRIAGRAGVELGRDDAVAQLEQAAASEPTNLEVWRELTDALLAEGRLEEAKRAIGHAVEQRPDDVPSLIDLAHVLHVSGESAEAIRHLEHVLDLDELNLPALRGLLGMYRQAGRPEDALVVGRKVISCSPGDIAAAIDVAEIALELQRLEDAAEGFRWLRDADEEPDHAVYAVHGLIEVELRRERWRAALDLAVEATRLDRFGRTTDALAYIVAQVFGPGNRTAPERHEVEAALAASRDEHRQLHANLDV